MQRHKLFIIVLFVFSLSCCDVVKQATQLHAFTKCKFRLYTIENLTLAGVNARKMRSLSEFNLLDAAKISASLVNGTLPLSFTLNVESMNPNQKTAAINSLQWILLIDDMEITQGSLHKRFEIFPDKSVLLPLHISVDLKQVLSQKSGDALINLALNLTGTGNRPSRITLKAKPTVLVAGREINYSGYIEVTNEFGA